MTCDGGMPLDADRFELDAAFRSVGIGGVGVGPLEVAAELGTGRRPAIGVSDMLRIVGSAGGPGRRSGRSMLGRRGGEKTMVDAGTIRATRELQQSPFSVIVSN